MNPEEYHTHCTVGDLLDYIEKYNIPRDAKVLYQRIEDVYFEKNGWKTYDKPDHFYYLALERNELIDSGEFSNKDNYPDIEDPEVFRTTPEELENLKSKYIVAWSPVYYHDEKHLFIDAHY